MRIYRSLEEIPDGAFAGGTVIAIGKFDGLHLGHQALLADVARVAAERGLEPVVFTFENNPLGLLDPERCPDAIMSPEQRLAALEQAGTSTCVMVPFDRELASVTADAFIRDVLVGTLHAGHLSVGENFRFGNRGAGDATLLAAAGAELGFTVRVVERVEDPVLGPISSSRIRAAIVQGDVATAARMMGRPASVTGTVVHGEARGRELGFPTANLGGEIGGLVPSDGIYAGWVMIDGVRHEAAISVGVNLTFDPSGDPSVEAYVLDFSGDLYGKVIEVQFVERLRGMVAFAGVEALIERIHEDVRQTRAILVGQHA